MPEAPYPNHPLKSRLPSKGDYKVYSGYDLDELFGQGADAFLFRTAMRFEAFLASRLFVYIDRDYPRFNDRQKELYKYALMEQITYTIINGDITSVSDEDGNEAKIVRRAISPDAKQFLMNAGIWTKKFPQYGRDCLAIFKSGGPFYD